MDCPTSSSLVVLLPLLSLAAESRTPRLRVCVKHPVFPQVTLCLGWLPAVGDLAIGQRETQL